MYRKTDCITCHKKSTCEKQVYGSLVTAIFSSLLEKTLVLLTDQDLKVVSRGALLF